MTNYSFLLHSIEHIFKDMSYPVVIMHFIICLQLKILCNLMIWYIWLRSLGTLMSKNFFCRIIRSHQPRFCFQPIYVLTCFWLFCLPFSMFVPYFRSSEISWRKKLHHKVTVPFHIYMMCIYGTFHSYSFQAIVAIYSSIKLNILFFLVTKFF